MFGTTHSSTLVDPYVGIALKRDTALVTNAIYLSYSYGASAGNYENLSSVNGYVSGRVVLVGVFESGRQLLLIKTDTGIERCVGTRVGNISVSATARLEIGESLLPRNCNASCAVAGLSDYAWPEKLAYEVLTDVWGKVFAPQTRRIWVGAAAASGYTLTADAATFTEAGQDAGLYAGRNVAGDAAAFTVAGQDAGLYAGRNVAGDAAAFTVAGQDAGLYAGRNVAGDAAAFTVAGQDAGLYAGRKITADAGAFALSGQDAALTYAQPGVYTLPADAGSFALSGQDATLTYTPLQHYVLTADAASFAVNGQAAALAYSGESAATTTGQPSGYTSPRALPEPAIWRIAATGVIGLTGQGTCTHIAPRVERHRAHGAMPGTTGSARTVRGNQLRTMLREVVNEAMLLR